MTQDCPACGQATPTTYTDVTVILDRSGSMGGIQSDTIGNFNSFLKEQKEAEGSMRLSLVQFDTAYEVSYDGIDIREVTDLCTDTYRIQGMTALLDALGRGITNAKERISKLAKKDRPNRVVFAVITDGDENSSCEFTLQTVAGLVKQQTDDAKWDFIFLGADIDSFGSGSSMNIAAANTVSYAKSASGVSKAYETVSKSLLRARSGESTSFTAQEVAENQSEIDKLG